MGPPEELPSPSLHSSLCALDLAPDHRLPGPRSRGLRGRRMPRCHCSLFAQNHRQMWPQAPQIRKGEGKEVHAPV